MLTDFYQEGGEIPEDDSVDYGFFPTMHGSISNGTIRIEGRSIMCDVAAAYDNLLFWLEHFLESKPVNIRLEFDLAYANEASLAIYKEILKRLGHYGLTSYSQVVACWFYSQETIDFLEEGRTLQEVSPVEFLLNEVKE